MEIGIRKLPESISALVGVLDAEGFELVASRGSGLANHVVDLRLAALGVRISVDRGQWWIELGILETTDLYDPDVWVACLDNLPVPYDPMDIAAQASFVRARWRDVAAASASPDVYSCLSRTRATRARERLGLPPIVGEEL